VSRFVCPHPVPPKTGGTRVGHPHDLADLGYTGDAMSGPHPKPGQGIVESALAARDSDLIRKIAAERKGLTEEQRNALKLVADLLDRATDKRGGEA
jgi:hypothetical protein